MRSVCLQLFFLDRGAKGHQVRDLLAVPGQRLSFHGHGYTQIHYLIQGKNSFGGGEVSRVLGGDVIPGGNSHIPHLAFLSAVFKMTANETPFPFFYPKTESDTTP